MPSNPGTPAPYHYGAALLLGLLAPPSGPDLAFTEELLGAYAWICLALVVATALLRASGLAVLIGIPLLLTFGVQTYTSTHGGGILQFAVPTGLPSLGIRVSLTDIFLGSLDLPRNSSNDALPNIFKPAFTLS